MVQLLPSLPMLEVQACCRTSRYVILNLSVTNEESCFSPSFVRTENEDIVISQG